MRRHRPHESGKPHPAPRGAWARALALACAGASALPLWAQATLERVELTGTRIKRLEAETASVIQTLSRDDIAKSGATNLTEVLRGLPAGNVGGVSSDGPVSSIFGSGGISLRGLGAGSTLVLINGRRVAPFGFGPTSFVDTNSIPVDAIERVEVLLDGASAVYGADAIGGVVNIVLRRGFEGLVASAGAGRSSHGDGASRNAAITLGRGTLGRDGYNLLVHLAHRSQDPVTANQRERTRDADFRRDGLADRRSDYARNVYRLDGNSGFANSAPGNFIGPLSGLASPCVPVQDRSDPFNGRCINDNTGVVVLATGWKSDAAHVAGVLALPAGFELFGDASLNRSVYRARHASYDSETYGAYTLNLVDTRGLYGNAPGGQVSYLILPVGHPQNPLPDAEVGVRYLFDDVAAATTTSTINQRYTLGVRGLLAGWDVESALMVSRGRSVNDQRGFLRDSVFLAEVLDAEGKVRPGFILGNAAANSPDLMARLFPVLRNVGRTGTDSIDLRASRELWQLPGGRLAVSLGAEHRRESVESVPDGLLSAGDISLWGAQGTSGKRRVSALHAEAVAPLLKTVELSLATRWDDNSDFGRSHTPKAGLKWRALPQLLLRASYAKGFRAPSLPEQQVSTQSYYVWVQDPKLCPIPDDSNPQCGRYVVGLYGRAGDLKAETSTSHSLGLVFQPWRQASLAVDLFDIKRKNEVTFMSTSYLLAHEADFPGKVERDPVSGQIDTLILNATNLARTHVRGVDVEGRWQFPLPDALGRLTLSATYNKLAKYEQANAPGLAGEDTAGFYLQPKERMRLGLGWDRGPWTAQVTWNYTGAYAQKYDTSSVCGYALQTPPRADYCRISSWLTADAYLSYRGFRNLELSLSVRNVDNRAAPFDADQLSYLQGFNPAYHNQMGRHFQLAATYTFR